MTTISIPGPTCCIRLMHHYMVCDVRPHSSLWDASRRRAEDVVDPLAAPSRCDDACPGLPKQHKRNIISGRQRRGPPCRTHDCCQVAVTWLRCSTHHAARFEARSDAAQCAWDERDDAATTLHSYEQDPTATATMWREMRTVAAPGRVARALGLVAELSSSPSLRDAHARQHPHLPWDRLPELAHALGELLDCHWRRRREAAAAAAAVAATALSPPVDWWRDAAAARAGYDDNDGLRGTSGGGAGGIASSSSSSATLVVPYLFWALRETRPGAAEERARLACHRATARYVDSLLGLEQVLLDLDSGWPPLGVCCGVRRVFSPLTF